MIHAASTFSWLESSTRPEAQSGRQSHGMPGWLACSASMRSTTSAGGFSAAMAASGTPSQTRS